MRRKQGEWLVILLAVVCLCAAPAPAQGDGSRPNVHLYDMGSGDSPLWSGFMRVTPGTTYDAKQGYGWVLRDRNAPRAYVKEDMDALAADYVSDAPAGLTLDFRQDLPNGEYVVWVLTGSLLSVDYLVYPHALRIQGRDAVNIQPRDGDVFRAVKYEWSKGDDIYDQFVARRFRWLRCEATVSDGSLTIGFVNGRRFPVCAIAIAEKAVAEYMDEEIRTIGQQRRAVFEDIWTEVPVTLGDYEPASSQQERARGYIVSAVNCLDDVLPGSPPPVGASRSRIEIFATPGEQEQASFAVYGLTDLRQVRFDVTDLRAADGKAIPASAIERGLVQFAPRKVKGQAPRYDIHPVLILPARPTFVGEDTCKRFWITVHVPEDAAAGIYEGTLRVSSLDASPCSLKLRLRVLPLKLTTPPVERYFYFSSMQARSLMGPYDEKKYWDSIRAQTRYLKENEFCYAFCWPYYSLRKDDNGKEVLDIDFSFTEKVMEIVKEENAWPRDNKMPCRTVMLTHYCTGYWRGSESDIKFAQTAEGRARYIRAVKAINKKAVKSGWPEIVFECGGEFCRRGGRGKEYALAAYSALREAGVATALRGGAWGGDGAAIAKGWVDYPVIGWSSMTKKLFPIIKASPRRGLWIYNSSRSRLGYGWICFKHGFTRAAHEIGIEFRGAPGNIFDDRGGFPNGGLPTSLTSLAPSVWLKRIVEGADDLKYLYTLDGLIKKADASGKSSSRGAARAARTWIEERLKTIPEYVDRSLDGEPRWANEVDKIVDWRPGDYDKYRWQMAEFIMAIRKELGE